MKTQARSELELEMKITNQLKVSTFAKKVESEEDKYQKIPQYVRCSRLKKVSRRSS